MLGGKVNICVVYKGNEIYSRNHDFGDGGVMKFGSNIGNEIVIESKMMSAFHGIISYDGTKYYIRNHNSSNGVYVDNKYVHRKMRIDEVSKIRIGSDISTCLIIKIMNEAKVNDSERREVIDSDAISIEKVLIGRAEDNDICISHVGVSKYHAEITNVGNDFFIKDLKSANGIFINGKRSFGKHKIEKCDVILIMNTEIIYDTEKWVLKGVFDKCDDIRGNTVAITINNLSKTYTKKGVFSSRSNRVLSDISFNIYSKEFVGVLGTSGAGKSVLISCISGREAVAHGSVILGSKYSISNRDIKENLIGYVPQADIVHGNLTVEACLFYQMELVINELNYSSEEKIRKIEKVLNNVGLTKHRKKLIRELSGGQRKRVSIAIELLSEPEIFFLDEPTSGLDPYMEASVMETLKNMTNQQKKTVIMSTHYLANVEMFDRMVILGSGGYLCYQGSLIKALEFFDVKNIAAIYPKIDKSENAEKWANKFRNQDEQSEGGV